MRWLATEAVGVVVVTVEVEVVEEDAVDSQALMLRQWGEAVAGKTAINHHSPIHPPATSITLTAILAIFGPTNSPIDFYYSWHTFGIFHQERHASKDAMKGGCVGGKSCCVARIASAVAMPFITTPKLTR